MYGKKVRSIDHMTGSVGGNVRHQKNSPLTSAHEHIHSQATRKHILPYNERYEKILAKTRSKEKGVQKETQHPQKHTITHSLATQITPSHREHASNDYTHTQRDSLSISHAKMRKILKEIGGGPKGREVVSTRTSVNRAGR